MILFSEGYCYCHNPNTNVIKYSPKESNLCTPEVYLQIEAFGASYFTRSHSPGRAAEPACHSSDDIETGYIATDPN
jgi:hypothetical protein